MIRFVVHKVVLAGSSNYFKISFSPQWSSREILFRIKDNEIEPFRTMLKFFYFGVFDDSINSSTVDYLLKVLFLADRVLAPQCISAITKIIISCHEKVTQSDICAFFSSQTTVLNILDLKAMFSVRIMKEIGNLDCLYSCNSTNDKRCFFQILPLEAIVTVFKSRFLTCSSESICLRVILKWIRQNFQENSTELFKLKECIRVGCLDFSIVNEIVEDLKWLGISKSEKKFILAYVKNIKKHPEMSFNPSFLSKIKNIPDVWFENRQYLTSANVPFKLPFILFPKETLKNMKDNELIKKHPSVRVSFRGYLFTYYAYLFANGKIMCGIDCRFPMINDEKILHVFVKYSVSFGNSLFGIFYQLSGYNVVLHDGNSTIMSDQQMIETFRMNDSGIGMNITILDIDL